MGLTLFPTPAGAVNFRLIDVHMHVWQSGCCTPSPTSVIAKMDAAGVAAAVVSSIPDDNSGMLQAQAPERFVKFLPPELQRGDSGWFQNLDLLPYMRERLGNGTYRGIGEFHLFDPTIVGQSRVQRILDIAIESDLILLSHSGADVIDALFAARPGLKIIWAHAGLRAPPGEIARMFGRYPNLYADLSLRTKDILRRDDDGGGRRLAPGWRRLFYAFPARLMIGSDVFTSSGWRNYEKIISEQRQWLGLLPHGVARAVGAGNIRRLLKQKITD